MDKTTTHKLTNLSVRELDKFLYVLSSVPREVPVTDLMSAVITEMGRRDDHG